MANQVIYTSVFTRKVKDLKKKHFSLINDLEKLAESLIQNPRQGVDLGGGLFKIRLAVKSKGKGKSGGYRVITYLVDQSNDNTFINMLMLYDKSEESSINKEYLLKLIKELF
ncbi:MAG: type II toxin-antitoxin system RelE/ParE family toxin [Bacteroidetes bacterium]|nr:type II toxin-antitoxin system RelE/ParE family toxin [Bacteroidota bacterium]